MSGAKNSRQDDKFLKKIISLSVLNDKKSNNTLNETIIAATPNGTSILFFNLLIQL